MNDTLSVVIFSALCLGALVLIAWMHKRHERIAWEQKQRNFELAYGLGYFDGWIARHYGSELEEMRPTPEALREAMPSLLETHDTFVWRTEYDHMTMKEFRQMQVTKLNEEMRQEPRAPRDVYVMKTLVQVAKGSGE